MDKSRSRGLCQALPADVLSAHRRLTIRFLVKNKEVYRHIHGQPLGRLCGPRHCIGYDQYK